VPFRLTGLHSSSSQPPTFLQPTALKLCLSHFQRTYSCLENKTTCRRHSPKKTQSLRTTRLAIDLRIHMLKRSTNMRPKSANLTSSSSGIFNGSTSQSSRMNLRDRKVYSLNHSLSLHQNFCISAQHFILTVFFSFPAAPSLAFLNVLRNRNIPYRYNHELKFLA
jgi:hypothetical protein